MKQREFIVTRLCEVSLMLLENNLEVFLNLLSKDVKIVYISNIVYIEPSFTILVTVSVKKKRES